MLLHVCEKETSTDHRCSCWSYFSIEIAAADRPRFSTLLAVNDFCLNKHDWTKEYFTMYLEIQRHNGSVSTQGLHPLPCFLVAAKLGGGQVLIDL